MQVGEAVADALGELGINQVELSRRMGVSEATVSRLLDDTEGRTSLRRIRQIEDGLGLPRGELLRRVGAVGEAATVEEMLEVDPALTRGHRQMVLDVYRGAVERSEKERSARRASASPTPPRTRKS